MIKTVTFLDNSLVLACSTKKLWIYGRSTKLTFQSPVKPKVGAVSGSENQKSVKGATFGAQNQCAFPFASIAHQRAFLGAFDQSIFTVF